MARWIGGLYNLGGGLIISPKEDAMEELPKLDREAYREQMRAEVDRVLKEVADAIDEAPRGRVIRDSEERARDALDRFRTIAYQKAMQLKIDAAEAAFPPSGQRDASTTLS
jgi:hypothetical protein